MIDVSELIDDPDFAQTFTVTRTTGSYTNGRFVGNTSWLTMTGSIQPMNTRDMQQLPQGDTIKGAVNVFTKSPIYTTQLTATGGAGNVSDEITWQGEQYKILQVQNFIDYGYYQAAAVRKLGA